MAYELWWVKDMSTGRVLLFLLVYWEQNGLKKNGIAINWFSCSPMFKVNKTIYDF